MPKMVRVRLKSTGALIWVDESNLGPAVEMLPNQPSIVTGEFTPKPHLDGARVEHLDESSTEPDSKPAEKSETAGKSGTKKEEPR